MSEINIIYKWKNKEVKTTLTEDEKLLLIDAIHSKSVGLSPDSNNRLLEEKIVYGLLGSSYRYISDSDDVEEFKRILKAGVDLNFNFQVDISLD